MKRNELKKKNIVNRFTINSVFSESCLWLALWGLYILWAGYSPCYPKTAHSEPLYALVIFCFMAFLFFIGNDRENLKVLIFNSILGIILVLSLLSLNIYRALTDKFPESWKNENLFFSEISFILIQIVFLFITLKFTAYTYTKIKKSEIKFSKIQIGMWLVFLIILISLLLAAGLYLFL